MKPSIANCLWTWRTQKVIGEKGNVENPTFLIRPPGAKKQVGNEGFQREEKGEKGSTISKTLVPQGKLRTFCYP